MTLTAIVIALYLVAQFGIGLWIRRSIRTEDDYLLAGRRLGYTLATFSIFATWFGAESIISSSGQVVTDGLSLSSAEPFGYGLCLILLGVFFAVPLWRRKLTTLADLFEDRFGADVARLAAVIMIPTSLLWAAAQIRAFGYVLGTATTLDPTVAIVAAAALAVAYTTVGGLMVDAITDVIQGLILAAGLLMLLLFAVSDAGGWQMALSEFTNSDALRLGGGQDIPLLESLEAWAIPVFGSLVAAELVTRVIATRTATIARRSAIIAGCVYIAVGMIPVFLAVIAAHHLAGAADPEQLLPTLAQNLLPAAGYALFSAALISAILSTVDSTLLVASGLFSHNLIVPMMRVTEEGKKVKLARTSVVVFGVVCCLLAITAEGVFELVELASSLGSAGILVTVVFGLFTNFGGAPAAKLSLISGVAVYVAANWMDLPYPFLMSLAVSLLAYGSRAPFDSPK